MNLSRVKSLLPAPGALPARRKFRDAVALRTRSDVSVLRLVGFFVGGILLANLMLMTSAAYRGHATQSSPSHPGMAPKRGPVAAFAEPAPSVTTDGHANSEAVEPAVVETPKPAFAALCIDQAREKLTAGLTQYYLQRGLRVRGYPEALSNTAAMTALLAGPAEPQGPETAAFCAG